MTGFQNMSFIEMARDAGADSFIYKESAAGDFLDCLERTLAGEHLFPDIREQMLSGQGPLQAVEKIAGGTLFIDETVRPGVAGHFDETHILEPGHDDDFLAGVFLFQALRQGNAAVLPFHTDIQEDDVGPDFLTGWFDEFRKRQGTDDFDVPLQKGRRCQKTLALRTTVPMSCSMTAYMAKFPRTGSPFSRLMRMPSSRQSTAVCIDRAVNCFWYCS